ncbi:MAG: hypothetical protein Q7N50_05280 [Armatimonadota bacterium]|nr:hypothetical protein [Armatimonadota bacterium]
MTASSEKPPAWTQLKLRPMDTAMSAMVALLWIGLIGALISSERMLMVLSGAFRVQLPVITTIVKGIASATVRAWFISTPVWSAVFISTFVWALRIPEKRPIRLSVLMIALTLGFALIVVATYIPVAQVVRSLTEPSAPGGIFHY